jgi:outer membrane protein insertion porin family
MRIIVKKGFLLVFFILYSINSFADTKISKIIIENNHRIESKTIESYLKLKVGDLYNDKIEIESIRNLYSTEFFDDINMKFNNGVLLVKVYETPMIIDIKFEGNSKIKTNDLEQNVDLYKGDSYHQPSIDKIIRKITQIYNSVGRYLVKVEVKKIKLDSNRVKLVFKISEGPKTKVKNITFVGNNDFASNILRKEIQTSETAWYSFMSKDDVYNPFNIEQDLQMLKHFYSSKGYIDFKHIGVNAELTKNKKYFNIVYTVEEGEQYKFGNVTIKNEIDDIKLDEKKLLVKIKTDAIYNGNLVKKVLNDISIQFENQGFQEVQVSDELDKNISEKKVNLTFVIKKTSKVYLKNINISGNHKTHDNVIRRSFKIYEGDVFNRRKVERGIREIKKLNYFDPNIGFAYNRNDEGIDKYDLNIEVEEKSTASLGFSAGWSTASGFFGMINFREMNLSGTGKILDVSAQKSSNTTKYSLGLTEPSLFDSDILLGGHIFKKSSSDADLNGMKRPYSEEEIGFRPKIGYDITPDFSHSISYLIENTEIKLNQDKKDKVPQSIKEQEGKKTTSSISSGLTFDRLDNRYDPKYGYLLSMTQEFAGLGGDINFFKNEFSVKYFHSFFNDKLTLKMSAEYGNIFPLKNETLRIVDRFNLGEPRLRGFESYGIGPLDMSKVTKNIQSNNVSTVDKDGNIVSPTTPAATQVNKDSDEEKGESLGGNKYYLVNLEAIIPVKSDRDLEISLVGFVDLGSLWGIDNTKKNDNIKDSDSLRISSGIGIILKTPLLPIRIDFAFPIKKEDYDREQKISISSLFNL